jgi:hypothetical protein
MHELCHESSACGHTFSCLIMLTGTSFVRPQLCSRRTRSQQHVHCAFHAGFVHVRRDGRVGCIHMVGGLSWHRRRRFGEQPQLPCSHGDRVAGRRRYRVRCQARSASALAASNSARVALNFSHACFSYFCRKNQTVRSVCTLAQVRVMKFIHTITYIRAYIREHVLDPGLRLAT